MEMPKGLRLRNCECTDDCTTVVLEAVDEYGEATEAAFPPLGEKPAWEEMLLLTAVGLSGFGSQQ